MGVVIEEPREYCWGLVYQEAEWEEGDVVDLLKQLHPVAPLKVRLQPLLHRFVLALQTLEFPADLIDLLFSQATIRIKDERKNEAHHEDTRNDQDVRPTEALDLVRLKQRIYQLTLMIGCAMSLRIKIDCCLLMSIIVVDRVNIISRRF